MKKTKIVIFGITGDLSRRKLLPSLDNALRTNKIDNIEIIGVSRREINVADLLTKTHSIDIEHTPLRYIIKGFSMDLDNPNDYANLKNFINLENDEQLLLYLSVPAASAMNIAKNCGDVGINSNNVKILLEKPFGYDLESAEEFINCINKYYSEEQTYRIDHYLAKTAALNVVKYRLQNPQINTKWNDKDINSITVIASEKIGIEGRSVFYEQTGAVRDFIQGHLMQLLSLCLIDVTNFNFDNLQNLTTKVIDSFELGNDNIRGQYIGYKTEVNNPNSFVETAAAVEIKSNNSNWINTKFLLFSGKNFNKKLTTIEVLFNDNEKINFNIQPENNIIVNNKDIVLQYDSDDYFDAYEHVLVDAINSIKTRFVSQESIIKSWTILKPLLNKWQSNGDGLIEYNPGSDFVDFINKIH